MSKAKEEYMKFWNIPEEDLESEDIKQFELMDAYAEQVAKERAVKFEIRSSPKNEIAKESAEFEYDKWNQQSDNTKP